MGLAQFVLTLSRGEVTIDEPEPIPNEGDFVSYVLSISNKFVDVYFDRPVYGPGHVANTTSDFQITDFVPGGVTVISIASVKKPDHHLSASATNLAGGESVIRFFLTLTGTPDGTESFRIKPVTDQVVVGVLDYPTIGDSKSTGTISLNINPFTLWDAEVPTLITTTGLGVSALNDLMGNINLAQGTDADRPLHFNNRAIQFDSSNTEFMTDSTHANFEKDEAEDFAVVIKDLRPNNNANVSMGWIIAYFHQTNSQGWAVRQGTTTNRINMLMFDGTNAKQADFQNFEDRKGNFIIQNEGGTLRIYDEFNNRVGSEGTTDIGNITWTSISLHVGRRQGIVGTSFNGEWAKLAFINQSLNSAQRVKMFANLNRQRSGLTGTLTKYLYPIVNGSIVSTHKDTMQIFMGDVVYRSGVYYIFYGGNAADGDIDRIFKATKTDDDNPYTTFTKHLTAGEPTVILGPSGVNGTYDEDEVFPRTVFYDEHVGEWKMYFTANQIGASPQYKTGLATSADGTTWTKVGERYSDGTSNIIMFVVVQAGAGDYRALITRGVSGATNDFIKDYATSTDGETWVKVGAVTSSFPQSILITKIQKVGDEYIVFSTSDNRDTDISNGTRILMHKTTDFSTFIYIGELMRNDQPNERAVVVCGVVPKNDTMEIFYHYFKNQNKTTANGGEGYIAIRMAILNTNTLQQPIVVSEYPSWVKKYWPLNPGSATGSAFREIIDGDTANFTGPQWSLDGLQFFDFLGTGFTFPNNGLIFSPTDFALKLRVEIVTTGTINLFSSGTDIVVQLVSGNLRVALNNATKDYITTADIAKPTGITDPGTHVYVGFIWQGGTLRLCVGNTIGISVTQTVNNAMTNIANGGSDVLLCSGATIEARSFVTMSGQTDQQYLDTDL